MENKKVIIANLFPSLMGTYGDGGNVKILVERLKKRNIKVEVVEVNPGDAKIIDFADIYVLGGGEDAGQSLASNLLLNSVDSIKKAISNGAVIFAVCAGMQIIGTDYEVDGGVINKGLGIIDIQTRRRTKQQRAVGEVLAKSDVLGSELLTGYENHGGGTKLGRSVKPLAQEVIFGVGNGYQENSKNKSVQVKTEGAIYNNIICTYLHGPVLARNPKLADFVLSKIKGLTEIIASIPVESKFVEQMRKERIPWVKKYGNK